MKFNKILEKYGKTTNSEVMSEILKLCDRTFDVGKWDLVNEYDSMTISSDSGDWYHVYIGKNALTEGCRDFKYNRAGYVGEVKDIYHEGHHVWIDTEAWNDRSGLNAIKSYKQITNTVRREFIRKYIPSAYYNCYSNDPSEMAAEWHGMRQTLNYFDSDPIVTKTEAENILYDLMMSEDCIHKEILDPYRDKLKTIYDVLDLFEERMKTCANMKYDVTMDINPRIKGDSEVDLTTTDKFLHDDAFKEYRNMLDTCKTGVEQDMVLEQFLIAAYPDIIRKAPLRLREEMMECRKHMELDTWKPGLHPVHPKRLNLSVGQISEIGELQLTDEDLATIPEDLQLTDEDLATIPVDGGSLNL